MDITKNVIEAHLDSGKTLPLRAATTKKGAHVWAVLDSKSNGERFFNGWGPKVSESITGHPSKITSIKVDGIGSVKVTHSTTEKGQPRATATKSFTSPVDHEEWTLNFRATLVSPGVVNLLVKVEKGSVSKARVLTEL